MESSIEFLNNEIIKLKSELFEPFIKDINDHNGSNIYTGLIYFPFKLPISFSGRSLLGVNENGNNSFFNTVLSILPSDNETAICFTTNIKNLNNLINILASYQDIISLLNFLESWMIYGSDYWFIEPDYWRNFSEKKQQRILNDLLYTDYLPTLELEYSIFDDIRKEILFQAESSNTENDIDYDEIEHNRCQELALKERRKLQYFDINT